ncbi:MAG: ABC transporter permease [Desulfarculus sp.]|nr:ABC transporter permease [Pseudomonadota bacterium]MBV1717657.1 ABC transporter permease [Desulfarculus sp.]MBU4573892.1 ABC transporter permease [Pseudomonadota bacterium]MBU4599198.1 ABC transporter permease [Pseudomonadota bacterium]MBV1739749.1 ABC transporter permease [Desulfarculus sp.]
MIFNRTELVGEMVRREFRDRHVGQVLGVVWVFGHPLLLMLIYTFLFVYVFPTRYGGGAGAPQDYSVNILAGIVCWLAFQDVLSRSSSTFITHANLVKQIVFPIEVLPIKTALAGAIPYAAGLLFVLASALWRGSLNWMVLTLPLVVFCQIVAMIGLAFLLASVGVFLRDVREFIQVFCTVNLFAQPILFNPYATPPWLQYIFQANPFSYFVWCWQDALFFGSFHHPMAWVVMPLLSGAVLWLGWFAFSKTRRFYGDVL